MPRTRKIVGKFTKKGIFFKISDVYKKTRRLEKGFCDPPKHTYMSHMRLLILTLTLFAAFPAWAQLEFPLKALNGGPEHLSGPVPIPPYIPNSSTNASSWQSLVDRRDLPISDEDLEKLQGRLQEEGRPVLAGPTPQGNTRQAPGPAAPR